MNYKILKKIPQHEIQKLTQSVKTHINKKTNHDISDHYLSHEELSKASTSTSPQELDEYRGVSHVDLIPVTPALSKDILDLVPEHILSIEKPKVIFIINAYGGTRILPHIDIGRRTALNIYLTPGSAETLFYKEQKESQIKHNSPGNWDDFRTCPSVKNLTEVDRYKNNLGDMTLLKVNTLHTVVGLENKPRIAISISFRKHFEKFINTNKKS